MRLAWETRQAKPSNHPASQPAICAKILRNRESSAASFDGNWSHTLLLQHQIYIRLCRLLLFFLFFFLLHSLSLFKYSFCRWLDSRDIGQNMRITLHGCSFSGILVFTQKRLTKHKTHILCSHIFDSNRIIQLNNYCNWKFTNLWIFLWLPWLLLLYY